MRRLLPVSIFVLPFGLGFGVAAVGAGLTPGQAVVMSATAFTGAAQFAALDFWPGPIAYLSLALVVLAVNARLIIMGAALSPWLNRLPPLRRAGAVMLLSDANFADAQPALRAGARDLGVFAGGGVMLWTAWVGGTAAGALGGGLIGDPRAWGVDVVMACFFAAVVVGMVADERDRVRTLVPVGAAVLVSIGTLGLLPVGWNVIAGALTGGAVAALWGAASGADGARHGDDPS